MVKEIKKVIEVRTSSDCWQRDTWAFLCYAGIALMLVGGVWKLVGLALALLSLTFLWVGVRK